MSEMRNFEEQFVPSKLVLVGCAGGDEGLTEVGGRFGIIEFESAGL